MNKLMSSNLDSISLVSESIKLIPLLIELIFKSKPYLICIELN